MITIRYKVEWHIRHYVRTELQDYNKNKRMLSESKTIDTHTRLVVSDRLSRIEYALSLLNEEERAVADLIFNKRYTQAKAELEGIGYKQYYNTMNKTIYMVARELDLI